MKKVMILVSAIVLTASAATAAYVCSQKSSGLFEANVEALTSSEERVIDVSCIQQLNSTCPIVIKMADGSSRIIDLPHSVLVSYA